jgi:hypothetical protein
MLALSLTLILRVNSGTIDKEFAPEIQFARQFGIRSPDARFHQVCWRRRKNARPRVLPAISSNSMICHSACWVGRADSR